MFYSLFRTGGRFINSHWALRVFAVAVLVTAIPAPALHAEAYFQNLGGASGGASIFQAKGVSSDGTYIVGQHGTFPFIWTVDEGLRILSDDSAGYGAVGISDDGNTIVGSAFRYKSARWTATEGPFSLGSITGYGYGGEAHAVSADGSVIIGYDFWRNSDYSEFKYKAYRWTEADGIQPFDTILNETSHQAHDISADGKYIVGTVDSSNGWKAYRWSEEDGAIYIGNGDAYGVSNDGSVVVGNYGRYPFRWTEEDGMTDLGGIDPLRAGDCYVHDVSGDGRIVVGTGYVSSKSYAVIWDQAHGMRKLHDVLIEEGLGQVLTGWHLISAKAISDDGNTIVGYGENPSGDQEAFMVVLPEPGTLFALLIPALTLCKRSHRDHHDRF